MVGVRVRADDAIDRAAGKFEDALEVRRVRRTRIDHQPALFAHDVGVGAGPGQRTGVRRNDAPDLARDAARTAGFGGREQVRLHGVFTYAGAWAWLVLAP